MNAKMTTILTLGLMGLGSLSQTASASDLSRFLERNGIIANRNNSPAYSTYNNYGYQTGYQPQYVYQGGNGNMPYGNGYVDPQYMQPNQPYFDPGMPVPPSRHGSRLTPGNRDCHCGHCNQCCHVHHGTTYRGYNNRGWGWNN